MFSVHYNYTNISSRQAKADLTKYNVFYCDASGGDVTLVLPDAKLHDKAKITVCRHDQTPTTHVNVVSAGYNQKVCELPTVFIVYNQPLNLHAAFGHWARN